MIEPGRGCAAHILCPMEPGGISDTRPTPRGLATAKPARRTRCVCRRRRKPVGLLS